ncbi:BTAD domain-containing putative transcriptional regulator [Asanoa iriomotensis]|uniref:SARP family transcriptional regulator n=1 Tax=Asanoa iriomotensis TaxID=234613 RepID=A0ABQ4CF91_9ACTN|nr:SARP family transcriptional regulator [Asanoa iriomotensis]
MHISVLGPLSLTRPTGPLEIGVGRHRIVLARLALTPNRPVGREELIRLLWRDDAPPSAANVLQTHISRLRRMLGSTGAPSRPTKLTLQPGGYVLRADREHLDLVAYHDRLAAARVSTLAPQRAFELLADGLEMWRGGDAAEDVPELGVDPVTAALADERVAATLRLARLGEVLLRQQQVLPLLRSLAQRHPWHESLHARLVVALAASGQQAAALDAFDGIRRRLVEELGVAPGAELVEARQAVLTGRWDTRERVSVNGRDARPWQAPAPPSDFRGRAAERVQLERMLRLPPDRPPIGPVVVCVAGMAGVGKTSLALKAAWSMRSDFPDGQVYIDLRGADDEPVAIAFALARLLRALGVEERAIPADQEEAAALYRSELSQRRVLVLLDNARNAAQVRPLLPGPGRSAVLVTSRNQLAELGGAAIVNLPVLSATEALEVLRTAVGAARVQAEPDEAEALVRACGLLPIALRVVGSRLAMRPEWKIRDLLDQLTDHRSRLEHMSVGDLAVMTSFELSVRDLAPLPAAAFRAGALIPGDGFSAGAVAALLAADEVLVGRALDGLVADNLLQTAAGGRYRYHDLLRLYAVRSADVWDGPPDPSAALGRLYTWYLARTAAAMRLVYADMVRLPLDVEPDDRFADVDAAMAWLNAEVGSLVAAVAGAAGGAHNARSWQLADQLRGFFFVRGEVVEWLATGQAGLAAAEAAGDLRAQAAMHQTIGQAHWAAGKHRLAADAYSRGIRAARRSGWLHGEAYLAHNLGLVHAELGRMDEAQKLYRRALRAGRGPAFDHIRAVTLNDLGTLSYERGQLTEAVDFFQAALRLNEGAARRPSAMANQGNLGMALRQLEEFEPARAHLEVVLAYYRQTGSAIGELSILDELSQLYRQLGEWVPAVGTAAEALRLSRGLRNLRAQAATLNTLGFALVGSRAASEAHARFDESLLLSREHGYQYFESQAGIGIAQVHLLAGAYDEAYRVAGDAVDIAARNAFRALHGDALVVQAKAALASGDLTTATTLCASAAAVAAETNSPGAVRDCAALAARIAHAGLSVQAWQDLS